MRAVVAIGISIRYWSHEGNAILDAKLASARFDFSRKRRRMIARTADKRGGKCDTLLCDLTERFYDKVGTLRRIKSPKKEYRTRLPLDHFVEMAGADVDADGHLYCILIFRGIGGLRRIENLIAKRC